MALTSITLQTLANFCATHADLLPLSGVGGFVNEPFLTIFNDTLSDLLSSPNDFKFNQKFPAILVTASNKQDYTFAGASAFTLGSSSTGVGVGLASANAITESGTTVTVRFLEPCRFNVGDTLYMIGNTVSSYNSTFTDDGNSTTWSDGWVIVTVATNKLSVTFTHTSSGLANSGAPGINDFGWLSSTTMAEMNNNSSPQNIKHPKAVRDLPPWSKVADPEKVCVVNDNGDGSLKIRFYYVPGSTIWGVSLVYQAKAPLKQALTENIGPFPDHYRSIVLQGLMYRMYRYLNNQGAANVEYQKLQQEIAKAQGYDDNEESNVYLSPEDSLMDSSGYWGGF